MKYTSLELCAGGVGQALGLEAAGFEHIGVVEYEGRFRETLKINRPQWNVIHKDIRELDASTFYDVDLLAGRCLALFLALQASKKAATPSGICFQPHLKLCARRSRELICCAPPTRLSF